jgi:hypothetical protein|tara:strand:- start:729 stop:1022 length:294 start_codon:yes stop_codon:yes gene_type:complete
MIIRVECNSLKEKDILFDLMQLAKVNAVFTRATMKGYLDESENREAEFVQVTLPAHSLPDYEKFCKAMKFFFAYIQGNTEKITTTISTTPDIGVDNE